MKARLPKGMGGGPSNMNSMIRQAQKMQEDMEKLSAELDEKEYSAASGGGAVKVSVTGKGRLTSVEISPEVVDPEDIEMLCDLVMAAANEALRTAEDDKNERMESITGGMNIPGMF